MKSDDGNTKVLRDFDKVIVDIAEKPAEDTSGRSRGVSWVSIETPFAGQCIQYYYALKQHYTATLDSMKPPCLVPSFFTNCSWPSHGKVAEKKLKTARISY